MPLGLRGEFSGQSRIDSGERFAEKKFYQNQNRSKISFKIWQRKCKLYVTKFIYELQEIGFRMVK